MPEHAQRVPGLWGYEILWQATNEDAKPYAISEFTTKEICLLLNSVTGWVDPRA
jgi:hypothetical protein